DPFRKVVKSFNAHKAFLPSWIHSLSYVRNICAHHSRLWNRTLAVKPRLPDPVPWFPYRIPNNSHVYCVLVIVHSLLRTIAPLDPWTTRVISLCDEFPGVPLRSCGMPDGWRELSPWSSS